MGRDGNRGREPVRERIIAATSDLIRLAGGDLTDVSLRQIARKAGVALGLINYHFQSKERLVEECVQRIIGGIINAFQPGSAASDNPFSCLSGVATEVMDYLLAHPAMARVSILGDMANPKVTDNTMKTVAGFSRLPGMPGEKMSLFCFTATLQAAFLRRELGTECYGYDLDNKDQRAAFIRDLAALALAAGGKLHSGAY